MKKLITLLILILTSFMGLSQTCPSITTTSGTVNCITPCATVTATPSMNLNHTNTYTVTSLGTITSPYSYTTGTNVSTLTDDIYTSGITIPFCFNFFDTSYTTLYVGANGNVTFNSLMSGAVDPWSISGPLPGSNCNATKNAIMSPWCDIYPPGGGTIKYTTYGTAPCRVFVISYNNLTMFLPGSYCTADFETSQIVLHETTNIIDIYIGKHNSPTLCTSWNSGYAVTGIESQSGVSFYTVPGQNGTAFTAVNQGWRFTPSGTSIPWTYSWTGPSGSVGTGPSVTLCPTVSTTYTVTGTALAPCGTFTTSSTSNITVTSSAVSISGLSTVCQGNNITLTSTGTGGIWSSSNTSVATVSGGGVVTGVSPGTTTITYVSGGCSDTKVITVYPTYNSTIYDTICDNQSVNFCGTNYNITGTYTNHFYTIHGCDSILTLNLQVNPTYNTTISADICQGSSYTFAGQNYTTSGTYNHVFTTIKGCDSTVNLNLSVHPNPYASIWNPPYKCIGDTITVALTSISSDVDTFFWNFNPATILWSNGVGGPYNISYNTQGVYTISLITSNTYCSDTTMDTIQIMGYPDATIAPIIYTTGNSHVCEGDQVILQSEHKQQEWLYMWTPSYILDNPNVASVKATIPDTLTCITLNIMNPFGCKSIDSICIKAEPCCVLEIPSAFSPNGDGNNDIFRLITTNSIKLHTFQVVNRWGQVVFETVNPSDGWDGTFGGVPQDLGTFFYFVNYECDGKILTKKGDVTLIR
jgi:gliding motility-associated-like protein